MGDHSAEESLADQPVCASLGLWLGLFWRTSRVKGGIHGMLVLFDPHRGYSALFCILEVIHLEIFQLEELGLLQISLCL